MAEINDLEIVDASNVDRFPENMPASDVNNGARALEGIIARWYNDINGTVDAAGTANVLTLAANQTISAYADGMYFRFTVTTSNTDAATLNVDSVGAKDVLLSDQSMLAPNALIANGVYTVVYKATEDCFYLLNPSAGVMPRGGIDGLIMSNGTDTAHDIDISKGVVRDRTDELSIPLNAVITKRIDAAWAVGTGNGGYGSVSSIAADTWYHLFLIFNGSTTAPVVDAGFDANISATQLLSDSGYTHFRRIGSVLTDGSSNILPFLQNGNDFEWETYDHQSETNPGTSSGLITLQVPPNVEVRAKMTLFLTDPSPTGLSIPYLRISTPGHATNPIASSTNYTLAAHSNIGDSNVVTYITTHEQWTDTSSRIRRDLDVSPSDLGVEYLTQGWHDLRGALVT